MTVHCQREALGRHHSHHDVFAARDDVDDLGARQINARCLGNPQFCTGQGAAGKCTVQSLAGQPDGISLRHVVSLTHRAESVPARCRDESRGLEMCRDSGVDIDTVDLADD